MNELTVVPKHEPTIIRKEGIYKVPVFSWDVMAVKYLSKREFVCVEEYVKTLSIESCRKVLREQVGTEWGWGRVASLIRRERVQKVVKDRMKERAISEGITRESWLSRGVLYEREGGGKGKMGWFFWKELGKAMGYYVEGEGSKVAVNFNLTQADGKI